MSTAAEAIVDELLRELGPRIVLALPLGLGKANHIANAFFRRAAADPSIDLEIFTALTLEVPKPASDLERRFIGPINERLFAGYPELLYAQALHAGTLPANITVTEFFFLAGAWLTNPAAQRAYVSANYTHAARTLLDRGVNVVGQIVGKRGDGPAARYSLSCNTDMTLDLLKARAAGQAQFKIVAQVNSELPFMPGDGDVPASTFSHILDDPETDFPLFAPPKEPVGTVEYAIGLHAASLVPDGGSLQIGIGKEGDAIAQGLILRHRHGAAFSTALDRLSTAPAIQRHTGAFAAGLHGLSEMLVDAFLSLIDADILKREVDGAVLHGAFFLGPRAFYRALREMPEAARARLRMTAVSFTNELYGDEAAKRPSREKARFINNAMMATLMGAVVSDGLADGRVVSGVGGQYNFVSQAFALPDARSIITVKSTRTRQGKTTSNILWSYGHETIPRHLRDIVITEYGVADLRGKSDRAVILAMLAVADSRFQGELLAAAKAAGKIERGYELPAAWRNNTPQRLRQALAPLKRDGLLPEYPFGTDFTPVEQRLIPALEHLSTASRSTLARALWQGLRPAAPDETECLARLGLTRPRTVAHFAYRALVLGALQSMRNA